MAPSVIESSNTKTSTKGRKLNHNVTKWWESIWESSESEEDIED